MEAAGPVDGDVALLAVEPSGTLHAAAGTDAAELEETVEDGAVVADVKFGLLPLEVLHVFWADLLQEIDVLVGVELGHLEAGGRFCAIDLHLLVDAIVHDQAVGQAYTVRLHGVASNIGEVPDVRVIEVGHLLGRRGAQGDAIGVEVHGRGVRHAVGCYEATRRGD